MTIYKLSTDRIVPLRQTTFQEQQVRERQDIQRLLRDQFDVVDPEVMVLAEEFGQWDDSRRRIDLLGIDRDARLVVVELKRTEDGGHMELQALRYAAMVSRMTFEQAVDAHARWLASLGREEDARTAILAFLGWGEPEEQLFGQEVRIVLVSSDFSKELTTTVLWLNERGIDVRCVRLRPYSNDEDVLLDVQQVLPLPEAEEYMVQVREKERRERQARESSRDYTRYDVIVDGELHERQAKLRAMLLVARALCAKGATPEQIAEEIPWMGSRLWRSTAGIVDAEEFDRRMAQDARGGGLAWDPKRWHCDDESLIRSGDRTWALSTQWDERTGEALRKLLDRWPGAGVRVEVSETPS